MSGPTPRRLAALAAALALLALAGGFAWGTFAGGQSPQREESAAAQPAQPAPRDPLAPLAVLGARDHWGSYRPPAAGDAAATAAAPRPAPGSNAIERDFVLVGIEGRPPRQQALRLPRGSATVPGSAMTSGEGDDIIRLRAGDTLIEGVTVTEVGAASVSFRAGDGTATLNLYGNTP
jgi:hypothetical protein